MASIPKLSDSDVRHLLRRLMFAAAPSDRVALRDQSVLSAFDLVWTRSNGSDIAPPTGASLDELRESWIQYLASSKTPLRENLVLFVHGLVGCSTASSRSAQALSSRLNLLRGTVLTSVPELFAALVLDPSMMLQIGMSGHGRDRVSDRPAKLILDHWTIGAGGYPTTAIEELSRALTGWTVVGPTSSEARFDRSEFDADTKTLFGLKSVFDAPSAVMHLARQPATARRFCARLSRHFGVATTPGLQGQLESIYLSSDGSMRALMLALVTSDEFWADATRWSLIKSPAHLAAGACRQLDIAAPPARALDQWLTASGQSLLDTPNNGEGGWPDQEGWITPPDRLAVRYALGDALMGKSPPLGFSGSREPRPPALDAWSRLSSAEVIERLDPAPGLQQSRYTVARVLATPQYQLA